jgi:hypothetical protein
MSDNDDKLERIIRQATQGLPLRRAPRSLESRVLAELQHRAARPWWRKSFVHWPVLARIGFVVSSAGIAQLIYLLGIWGTAGFETAHFRTAFVQQFAWVERGLTVFHAIGSFIEIMLRNIPAVWFYGVLGFFGVLYLALFGLGAAAYKALHADR